MSQTCIICDGRANLSHTGNFAWCAAHRDRERLLQWAMAREYPAITVTGQEQYAIGDPDAPADGALLWQTALLVGKQDVIDTLTRALFGTDTEVAS